MSSKHNDVLPAFGGDADLYPGYRTYKLLPHLAKNSAMRCLTLPEDAALYKLQADDEPKTRVRMGVNARPRCMRSVDCATPLPGVAGEFTHEVDDFSDHGKAKKRLHQLDVRMGSDLRAAFELGSARWMTLEPDDDGVASKIIRRVDDYYVDASVKAWDT